MRFFEKEGEKMVIGMNRWSDVTCGGLQWKWSHVYV